MFDASAYLKTLEPPVFIDPNGKKHVGVIIGADTWFRLQQQMRGAKTKVEDMDVAVRLTDAALYEIINAIFPPSKWKFWQKSVAYWIFRLPLKGRMRAVWDFMQSQAKAMGTELVPMPGMFPTLEDKVDAKPADSPTPGSSENSTNDTPASTTDGVKAGT